MASGIHSHVPAVFDASPTGSAKGDDIELKDSSPTDKETLVYDARREAAAGFKPKSGFRGFREFPRIGWDALLHDGRPENTAGDGSFEYYRVYKRRWLGLVQLTLLNIVISWEVSHPLPFKPHVIGGNSLT